MRLFAALLCLVCIPVLAQQALDPGLTYHRVWAVTPLVGSGTAADPRRPLLVPAKPASSNDRSGLLAYSMQLSDDGNFALVEFVFASRVAFQNVLAQQAAALGLNVGVAAPSSGPSATQTALQAAVPGLQMFERGSATQAQVQAVFQQYKKSFSFATYHPVPAL
jgi:hypothetical protein